MKRPGILKLLTLLCWAILLMVVLSGCAKTYQLQSCKVTAYGEELKGPANSSVDAKLTLSKEKIEDGVDVKLDYVGEIYTGTIRNSYVLWDKEPQVVANTGSQHTNIYKTGDGVKLVFNCKVKELWFEVT